MKKNPKMNQQINENTDTIDEKESLAAYQTEPEVQTESEVGKVEKRTLYKIDLGGEPKHIQFKDNNTC